MRNIFAHAYLVKKTYELSESEKEARWMGIVELV